jgi:hypothetical protein
MAFRSALACVIAWTGTAVVRRSVRAMQTGPNLDGYVIELVQE